MELTFDKAFAEEAQRSDISEDKWTLGWVEIVGGINGVPTAQQFNQFGYVFDKKANIAYAKAAESAKAIDAHSKDTGSHVTSEEKSIWNSKANTLDEHMSDTVSHVTAGEKSIWNSKADSTHTHTAATSSAAGFMTAADKVKLDGISDSADAVSVTRALTSGTKIGTITINGVAADLYCQTNTDTKYSAGTGIGISGTTISNSGVRSVATGGSNGTVAVNTNGTTVNVAVKGLASAAYQAVQTAAGTVGLHRMSSGTAAATTTNCPAGCWYGQYE